MKVSFTGFKNAGYDYYKSCDNDENITVTNLTMQLTNKGAKDLKTYKEFIKQNPDFKNTINDEFINISVDSITNNETNNILLEFYINNNSLDPDDPNFTRILRYARGLLKKVITNPIGDFIVNKDYLDSGDCRWGFYPETDLEDFASPYKYKDFVQLVHTPQWVKSGASFIKSELDMILKKSDLVDKFYASLGVLRVFGDEKQKI